MVATVGATVGEIIRHNEKTARDKWCVRCAAELAPSRPRCCCRRCAHCDAWRSRSHTRTHVPLEGKPMPHAMPEPNSLVRASARLCVSARLCARVRLRSCFYPYAR